MKNESTKSTHKHGLIRFCLIVIGLSTIFPAAISFTQTIQTSKGTFILTPVEDIVGPKTVLITRRVVEIAIKAVIIDAKKNYTKKEGPSTYY